MCLPSQKSANSLVRCLKGAARRSGELVLVPIPVAEMSRQWVSKMSDSASEFLVEQIRSGSESAWQDLIDRFEGRLSAFVRARLRDSHSVDDVVQETFMGFLRSLPFFDTSRDLESYLFTIAAHKLRDHLRKEGRHPLGLLDDLSSSDGRRDPSGRVRGASSLLASAERLQGEEQRLAAALKAIIEEWQSEGDFTRLKCIELLFVVGWPNKKVADYLGFTEQQVANYKFQIIERLARKTSQSS
jgi:RNA polymerase sigma-70 factor, ECF subfamily